MKKKLSIIFFIILFSPCLFAFNFFSERYVEVNTNIPISFSNNLIPVKDIFQKELMIDLRNFADSLPADGFNTIIKSSPCYAFNIRTPNFHLGLSAGVDIYNKLSISKDLFNFLGYGNEIGKELTVAITNNADVFVHTEVTIESKFKNNKLLLKPSLFIPLLSTSGQIGSLSFVNDNRGAIHADFSTDANVYSCFDITTIYNNSAAILDELSTEMLINSGFDMELEYSKQLSSEIALGAKIHFPIVPGQITNLINYSLNSSIDTYIAELDTVDLSSIGEDFSNIKTTNNSDVLIKVNRPFKLMGYLNYTPWHSIFLYELGLGLAVHHPCINDSYTYFEYYFASSFHLGGFFEAKLSTEYTDEVFKHQLQTKLNLRLIELDLGASLESSSFAKSFSTAGFGAFISVSTGF